MATVVICPYNVANFSAGGGHFWVYMQYAAALRALGCDVYWLEQFRPSGDPGRDEQMTNTGLAYLDRQGLGGKVILHAADDRAAHEGLGECRGLTRSAAEAVFRRADLLLNFHYAIHPRLLGRFRRTALMDIDPGLLQVWMSTDQLVVPGHDVYFTTGETVGTPAAPFPDCGLRWHHVRPPVAIDLWPPADEPGGERFTTVAGWWSGKWVRAIEDGKETLYENTKRVAFLEFIGLPRLTTQPLELALFLAESDGEERQRLEAHGWYVRDSREVARSPEAYRSYIQRSRGEFSCAKPSCRKLQNAWMSDRTLCYLASGKPAVVQHTGASSFIPSGEGLFRFTTLEDAAQAMATVNENYARHSRAAREIAEAYFDGRKAAETILNVSLVAEPGARVQTACAAGVPGERGW